MGLDTISKKSPHTLSFGQKHLVVLAGALVFKPKLLILDDPFAGLDARWRKKVQTLLLDISEKENMTLVWTGHRFDEMAAFADVIYHVCGGGIVQKT